MLELLPENKALCFEDSTDKPLYIFIYYWKENSQEPYGGHWQYFKTIQNAIALESMELDEGVLEGDNFRLGSFVSPTMKVKWQNDGIRYKDMVVVPVQKIGSEYIAYFDGYIASEKVSEDGQTVSVEISSFLSERLDIDVINLIRNQVGSFYEVVSQALASGAGVIINGIETDELLKKFVNANASININNSTLPEKITVSELLKQCGEFLGANIILKEKRIVDIEDMQQYQPSTQPVIDFVRLANVDEVAKSGLRALPNGYKRLEYIESNGLQYIDTGFYPNDEPRIKMTAKILKDTGSPALFGARLSGAAPDWNLRLIVDSFGNSKFSYYYISGSNVNEIPYNRSDLLNKKCHYDIGKKLIVDGIEYFDDTTTYQSYNFAKSIKIIGDSLRNANLLLYDCKIYNGDTLVGDLVPVLNSNSVAGLYDFITETFYASDTQNGFYYVNPIETYRLPYYINAFYDKTNLLKIGGLTVLTQTGTILNYSEYWNTQYGYSKYTIDENIFFESLSTQDMDMCWEAIREVSAYLSEQNLYSCDLQTVYPAFVGGADYLIIDSENQSLLPSGYSALDYIDLIDQFIGTGIYPNTDNFEIESTFEIINSDNTIFISNGLEEIKDTIALIEYNGGLKCTIGYDGSVGVFATAFTIPYTPKEQKINLKINYNGANTPKVNYSGTFEGEGESPNSSIDTGKELSIGSQRFYRFSYSEDGIAKCDIIPCVRKSDGMIGAYDIIQQQFINITDSQGNTDNIISNYESGDVVIPILSANSKGIHSIISDVYCKAVNINS